MTLTFYRAGIADYRASYLIFYETQSKLTRPGQVGLNMHVFKIHEAKTHLSHLVEKAAKGESFIIAKRGKQLVKVTICLIKSMLQAGTRFFVYAAYGIF